MSQSTSREFSPSATVTKTVTSLSNKTFNRAPAVLSAVRVGTLRLRRILSSFVSPKFRPSNDSPAILIRPKREGIRLIQRFRRV